MRYLLTVCISIVACTLQLQASCLHSGDDQDEVVVIPIASEEEGDVPKSLPSVSINCFFYADELFFSFPVDLGYVVVTVFNSYNGTFLMDTLNTQLGFVSIPLTGEDGHYYISIVTSAGKRYYGQFDLL
jgi:hypothetical protein